MSVEKSPCSVQVPLFGTDGIRGLVGRYPLVPDVIRGLGYAIGLFVQRTYGSRAPVIIGRDPRASGAQILADLALGLGRAGIPCHDVGILPTPAISFLVRARAAGLGIMISASHNPAAYNGIKFFDGQGEKLSPQDEAMLEGLMNAHVAMDQDALHPNDATLPPSMERGGVPSILGESGSTQGDLQGAAHERGPGHQSPGDSLGGQGCFSPVVQSQTSRDQPPVHPASLNQDPSPSAPQNAAGQECANQESSRQKAPGQGASAPLLDCGSEAWKAYRGFLIQSLAWMVAQLDREFEDPLRQGQKRLARPSLFQLSFQEGEPVQDDSVHQFVGQGVQAEDPISGQEASQILSHAKDPQDQPGSHQPGSHQPGIQPDGDRKALLQGLRIVVDAGNGAAAGLAGQIFSSCGAEVLAQVGNDPDGHNINDGVGAVNPQTLQAVVVALEADLGLAFDGDADRVIVVDRQGQVQDGDQIVAALAVHLPKGCLAENMAARPAVDQGVEDQAAAGEVRVIGQVAGDDGAGLSSAADLGADLGLMNGEGCLKMEGSQPDQSPANGVVGTVMSNLGLERFLVDRGISFMRSRVGDRWIAQELRQRGWALGGEACGHVLVRSLLPTGDGLLVGLLIAGIVHRRPHLFPLFTPMPSVIRQIPLVGLGVTGPVVGSSAEGPPTSKTLGPAGERSPGVDCGGVRDVMTDPVPHPLVRFPADPLTHPNVQRLLRDIQASLSHEERILVRASGTEPVIRVLCEGPDRRRLEALAQTVVDAVEDAVVAAGGDVAVGSPTQTRDKATSAPLGTELSRPLSSCQFSSRINSMQEDGSGTGGANPVAEARSEGVADKRPSEASVSPLVAGLAREVCNDRVKEASCEAVQ